ncbi:hypothetical protein HD554DRAFT_2037085 [Boletus coccyginus]|nr:hypothetical protein HD554DRAFT_2037085 [Boletus coccyginus]
MAKSINKVMNHDPPVDKFMMAINVPESVWALYVIFVPPLYLAVSENLADAVNSAKGLENPAELHTVAMCSIWAFGLELDDKLIKFCITQGGIGMFDAVFVDGQAKNIPMHP